MAEHSDLTIGKTLLRLVRGDITEAEVAAIVNAANSSLMGGGGVDGAIHRRGGPAILEACREIRLGIYLDGMPAGDAVVTTAGDLPAERVIHTVGPVWQGGGQGEAEILAKAYRSVLDEARRHALRTIAFPSISTGSYGYPIEQAARVALSTVASYLRAHPDSFDEIRFVLFTEGDLTVYRRALPALDASREEPDENRR